MIEVRKNIFVGNLKDYKFQVTGKENWWILHAAKLPYHKEFVGYSGNAAPKNDEYFNARRGNRLAMNIVDVPNPRFFDRGMILTGLDFLDEGVLAKKKILIHCNQGMSRAPSIGMLYLATRLNNIPNHTFGSAESTFKKMYSKYNPGTGIKGHLIDNWEFYCGRESGKWEIKWN